MPDHAEGARSHGGSRSRGRRPFLWRAPDLAIRPALGPKTVFRTLSAPQHQSVVKLPDLQRFSHFGAPPSDASRAAPDAQSNAPNMLRGISKTPCSTPRLSMPWRAPHLPCRTARPSTPFPPTYLAAWRAPAQRAPARLAARRVTRGAPSTSPPRAHTSTESHHENGFAASRFRPQAASGRTTRPRALSALSKVSQAPVTAIFAIVSTIPAAKSTLSIDFRARRPPPKKKQKQKRRSTICMQIGHLFKRVPRRKKSIDNVDSAARQVGSTFPNDPKSLHEAPKSALVGSLPAENLPRAAAARPHLAPCSPPAPAGLPAHRRLRPPLSAARRNR